MPERLWLVGCGLLNARAKIWLAISGLNVLLLHAGAMFIQPDVGPLKAAFVKPAPGDQLLLGLALVVLSCLSMLVLA
jgi:hypothetical protein